MGLDNVVFGKKKFSNILEEIYDNQKKKEKFKDYCKKKMAQLVWEKGGMFSKMKNER